MEEREKDKIYSKRVKAGKRTYFFDIKTTRQNDFFLSISESRKVPQGEGFVFEKSKMFIYKEDLHKFQETLGEVMTMFKNELLPDFDFENAGRKEHDESYFEGTGLRYD